jgi:subtilisin family serine protease
MAVLDGAVVVVVEAATGRGPELQQKVRDLGGNIQRVSGNRFRASLSTSALLDVASAEGVNFVRQPHKPVPDALSEGVARVNANAWHTASVTGSGVKVAIIDLGFTGYTNSIASGDLPTGVIARSFTTPEDITAGGETHGTRVAEIVHDMAPGATLYLAHIGDEFELADAVDWLISENVDVINHSVGWFNTGPGDGTGPIADIVGTARNSGGILWVNSIGNQAQQHWSGVFDDPDGDGFHNYSGKDQGNDIFAVAGQLIVGVLRWDDWPVSDQDYDLGLCRASDDACVVGSNTQNGTQPPTESVSMFAPTTDSYYFVIFKFSATEAVDFDLISFNHNLYYRVPAGSLIAPADSPDALAVGAAYYADDILESYSSRGPNKNGLARPDLVAPDCTTDSLGSNFCGTSGSSPHVAGAAALVLQANPGFFPDQIQGYLETRSLDLGTPGKDNRFGSGRLSLGAPTPDLTPPVVMITTPSDGASYHRGEPVLADYSCADEIGGSGIATCVGDVATGVAVNTATLGEHSFTVVGTDIADNLATLAHNYTVAITGSSPLMEDFFIALLNFFQGIPEKERFCQKENVASPAAIQSWTTDIK